MSQLLETTVNKSPWTSWKNYQKRYDRLVHNTSSLSFISYWKNTFFFLLGLTSKNSLGFRFLLVERLSSIVTLWRIGTSNTSYSTSIWTFLPSLVFDVSLSQLINMMLIFPFWAAYHINMSSNLFRNPTIDKTLNLGNTSRKKNFISNIKCPSLNVQLIVALIFSSFLANISSARDMFDIELLLGVSRYTRRNCCIISSSLFTPPDSLEPFWKCLRTFRSDNFS